MTDFLACLLSASRIKHNIAQASGSLRVNEGIILTDQTPNHVLALEVNSALMKLDGDELIEAVSEFMKFHKLSATPEQIANIPVAAE